jgi:hypothetical protein
MGRRTSTIIAFLFLSIAVANIFLIHWKVVVTDVNSSPLSFFLHRLEYYKKDTVHSEIPKFVTTSSADEENDFENNIEIIEKHNGNEDAEFLSDTALKKDEEKSVSHSPIHSLISYESGYNATEYQLKLDEALKPNQDKTSSSTWLFVKPWAGLCNQYMMFIGAVLLATKEGHNQILEESIQWKDTYGHEKYLQHKKLFDVVHWNTFYPQLPRIARYEKEVHPDVKVRTSQEEIEGKIYSKVAFLQANVAGGDPFQVAKNPTPLGQNKRQMINQYKMFARRFDEERPSETNVPVNMKKAFELIMKSAFRPHPEIQSLIDQFKLSMTDMKEKTDREVGDGFMVIHARVEPDMQNHPMCKVSL